MINYERLKNRLETFSEIGKTAEGGIDRIFGSDDMEECRQRMVDYFKECHMRSYIDSVGNVHGIFEQAGCDREIIIGSHIDTVKQGGRFDGIMGVIAGAEVVRALAEAHVQIKSNIHVVATNGEEGNELGGTFGSRAMMGLLPLDSESFLTKAASFGYTKEHLLQAVLDIDRTACYLELHIEQGPTLFNNHEQIGVVTGIVGLRRYQVTVYGKSNHAGTTMMEDRDDALVSASEIILMGDRLARDLGHNFVETVGVIQIFPNSAPVIPEKVQMVVEIRNESDELMDDFIQQFTEKAEKLAKVEIEPMVKKAPVKCDSKLIEHISHVCEHQKIKFRTMPSGATHDGNAFASKVPVGMIFVPSIEGISHSKDEKTEWADVFRGTELLLDVVKEMEG